MWKGNVVDQQHGTKRPQIAAVGIDLKTSNLKKLKTDKWENILCVCHMPGQLKKIYKLDRILPQSVNTLKSAFSSGAYSVAKRLSSDIKQDWLDCKQPKWRPKCRNTSTHPKGCMLGQKKWLGESHHPTATCRGSSSSKTIASTSGGKRRSVRSKSCRFEAAVTRVICHKRCRDGRWPSAKITNPHNKSLIEKAQQLNWQYALFCL